MRPETKKLIKEYQDLGGVIETTDAERIEYGSGGYKSNEQQLKIAEYCTIYKDDAEEYIRYLINNSIDNIKILREKVKGTPIWNELREEGY